MLNRRKFLQTNLKAFASITILPSILSIWVSCEEHSDNLQKIIQQIGNKTDEKLRYQLLSELLDSPLLSTSQKTDLLAILEIVDHWANGKELYENIASQSDKPRRYMSSYFSGKISPDQHILPQFSESDPFFPIAAFYRARMLVSETLEHGHIQKHKEVRDAYLGEAVDLLKKSEAAFPANPIIGMYLGKPIPWNAPFRPDSKAPTWANVQREILEKITDILHWWIDNRQLPDGQYGGGWGDDVEMWRKWIPILVGFKDEKVNQAQERLSDGLFALDRMEKGYTDRIFDVEHTAEDSSDTCTAMMHLKPDDEVWRNRAMRLIELMENFWTGRNERGFLQFKSTYFSSEEVDSDPRKACDTVYHPRTIQPALLYWQRTGDEKVGKLVKDWMNTWVDATQREENGKPAGIIPSAIHWPDGRVGGITDTWWDPDNHTDDPLYVWPSAMRMMLNTLLLTFYKSGDRHYLQPVFSMAAIYRKYLGRTENQEIGSEAWCASKMDSFLPDVLAKYRKLTNDTQFDDLLTQAANGYAYYTMSGETQRLWDELNHQKGAFEYNFEAFTSEVTWTDRVFRFASGYYNHIHQPPLPSYTPDFLFSMVSGNIGNAMYFPINAVRWLTPPRDIAVWVQEATNASFIAEVYSFSTEERTLDFELFLLEEGTYQLQIIDHQTNEVLNVQSLNFSSKTIISVNLLPQKLHQIHI